MAQVTQNHVVSTASECSHCLLCMLVGNQSHESTSFGIPQTYQLCEGPQANFTSCQASDPFPANDHNSILAVADLGVRGLGVNSPGCQPAGGCTTTPWPPTSAALYVSGRAGTTSSSAPPHSEESPVIAILRFLSIIVRPYW